MNLAEFPLCALSHRLKPDVKTLRFEDRTWDKGRNDGSPGRLTVTGSNAYGLPTGKDDEVLLGLIQLTRLQGFAERKVFFHAPRTDSDAGMERRQQKFTHELKRR